MHIVLHSLRYLILRLGRTSLLHQYGPSRARRFFRIAYVLPSGHGLPGRLLAMILPLPVAVASCPAQSLECSAALLQWIFPALLTLFTAVRVHRFDHRSNPDHTRQQLYAKNRRRRAVFPRTVLVRFHQVQGCDHDCYIGGHVPKWGNGR